MAIGAGSFLGGLAEAAVLIAMTLVAEALIRGSDTVEVLGTDIASTTVIAVALALLVVRVGLSLATTSTAAAFSADVMRRAQQSLLRTYLSSSHPVRSSRPRGDLQSVAVTHGRFTGDLANAYTQMAASVCGLLAFAVMALTINPVAFVAIVVVGGGLIAALRPLRSHSRAAARSYETVTRTLGREVTQVEALHREVHVFGVEEPVEDRITDTVTEGGRRYRRVRFLGQAVPQVFQSVLMAAAVLGLLAIVQTATASSDLATAGAVVLLLIRSMSSAQQLVTANQRIIELGSYARGLDELIATFRSQAGRIGTVVPTRLVPVRLRSVDFSYEPGTPVLTGLDLELCAGEVVGLVGPSGAGKSTRVELLLHLRTPTAGSVEFGGIPVDQIDPAELARRIAIVPQDPVLVDGTVAENVDFFRSLPPGRITDALDRADLAEQIDALPDGVDTRLGSDERALSGGQRQRLTIARALAGDPEVLVLDEPTSALDSRSEAVIARMISGSGTGRLTVVVAHRHSTLRSCTRILVLNKGRVEFDGTPEEVAEASPYFRSMLNADH